MDLGDTSIAVIIPFYRGMEYVPRLKDAFGGQRIEELIFVVDDAESAPALRREFEGWPNVLVLETAGSLGTSAARNIGLEAARSRWVAPVDQDDWWPTSFVEDLTLPALGAVLAYDSVIWHREGRGLVRAPETVLQAARFEIRAFDRDHDVIRDYLPMFKLVVRREDALSVGGYSGWAYAVEDYDFLMKLIGGGLRVEVHDTPKGHYLWHGESITRQIAAGSSAKGRRAFVTWMRVYGRLMTVRGFPAATRWSFLWRFGVAVKGWALLTAKERVPGIR